MSFRFSVRGARPVAARAARPAPVEGLEPRLLLAVFTVTTTADGGPGSLRQAIVDANRLPDVDDIHFAIPGAGVHTIAPASPLPELLYSARVDATTQNGYAGSPLVELDGSAAGPAANGLVVRGLSNSLVRGLAVNRFGANGLLVASYGAVVEANYVGLNPAGDAARPNGAAGIMVQAERVTVGGTTVAVRNVISGNAGPGVRAAGVRNGAEVRSLRIEGNYIGTDARGAAAVGNGAEGVLLDGADSSEGAYRPTIGGTAPGAGNVISGNGASGIRLKWAFGAIIQGNRIGTDAGGTAAVPNGHSPSAAARDGITAVEAASGYDLVIGGPTAAARNVIAANHGAGVRVGARMNVTLKGNYVGTDLAGGVDLGNAGDGVLLSNVFRADVHGNLISGNGGDGLSANVVSSLAAEGNYVGTNAAGTAAIANGGDGLDLLDATGYAGSDHVGPVTPPPVIDPAGTGRNVISGNVGHGVRFEQTRLGSPVRLSRNHIGTDVTGAARLGNGGSGVYVASPGARIGGWGYGNLISANGGDGVTVAFLPDGVRGPTYVEGNQIGTDAAGGPGLGNAGHGIAILGAGGVLVGSNLPNGDVFANTIAYNGGSGVFVTGATEQQNRITVNRIHSNGSLEVDLGGDGPTPNDPGDADAGPNRLLNFPIITEAGAVPGTTLPARTHARFTLNAEPLTKYQVLFFAAAAADAGGRGMAERSLGWDEVTTDAAGDAEGTASLAAVAPGEYVAARAVDPAGNTSEFGPGLRAEVGPVAGRFAFYNGSAYDGNDPAADARDDAAVAPFNYPMSEPADKIGSAAVTNYGRGINGLFVDLTRVPAGATLSADDFDFRTGPGDGAAGWAAAPAPTAISLRRGAGVGGTDRVTLVWAGGAAVKNAWLQVTVKPTADTGLSRADVFYFGNLAGNISSTESPLRVDDQDLRFLRNEIGRPVVEAWYRRAYDFDQDGFINVKDTAILRANYGQILPRLTAGPSDGAFSAQASLVLVPRADAATRRRAYRAAADVLT